MEADLGFGVMSYEDFSYGGILGKVFDRLPYYPYTKDARLVYSREIDSTNEEVKRRAACGADEGLVVVAASQTAGQGRSGRSFYSPECGSVYMSILLKPLNEEQFKRITVIAAVAVAMVINSYDFPEEIENKAGIKWVNDIFINNRKVGGIIAQAENYGCDNQYVVLGIGINVFPDRNVPKNIENIYGSIFGADSLICGDGYQRCRNVVCAGLCESVCRVFFELYREYEKSNCYLLYRKLSCVIGKDVVYISGNDEKKAFVEDIDSEGGLVLCHENGDVRTYRDGEIRIRV